MKLSISSAGPVDCHRIALDVDEHRQQDGQPIIADAVGLQCQLSSIISPVSTVTHALLPGSSAPGRVSLAQVHRCLSSIGRLPSRSFFIFGNRISHSLSPTIHNAAFRELGLPHHYAPFETPQIDEQVRQIIGRSEFGGASVTAPHKLQVQPLLNTLSDAATKIGAVNTIIVQQTTSGRQLHGDNTDWLGLLALIRKSVGQPSGNVTVLGAGGAARAAVFALQTFGFTKIQLVNRSAVTAKTLTETFPALEFEIVSSFAEASPSSIIIGCIPVDGMAVSDIPATMFDKSRGLVIEMSYLPKISALMEVASERSWHVYGGVDVLKEQAYAQFELWTGRRAPVQAIEEALETAAKSRI